MSEQMTIYPMNDGLHMDE